MERLVIGGLLVLLAIGCNTRPARIAVPKIDPQSAANRAIELCDTDGDMKLTKEELKKCPSILSAFDLYDTDGDQLISREEIAARLQRILDERNGILILHAEVKLDNRPLSNAKVRFIPESFMAGAIQPAEGQTDAMGRCIPAISQEDFPVSGRYTRAMQPGLYRVEVTHDTVSIPDRYHANSELGTDVSYRLMDTGIKFDLKSR